MISLFIKIVLEHTITTEADLVLMLINKKLIANSSSDHIVLIILRLLTSLYHYFVQIS